MRLLVDINHPAHVHYSKYLIQNLVKNGHDVLVTSRERPPCFELLKSENIPFISRGKGSGSILGKALYFIKGDMAILKAALKFKPDLFLCFMSPYAAQVAKLLGKPCIVVDDTEHAKLHNIFTYPFCTHILTPQSYYRDLGKKQIRFQSNLELNYLHPDRFTPNPDVYKMLGIDKSQPYAMLRLVAWGGHHDVGHSGIGETTQRQIVELLSERYKVFISSEKALPDFFEPYRIPLPPDKIHHVIYHASLFVGESGTMASESALLGTPAIYVNSLPLMGYLKEAEQYGMLFHFKNDQGVLDKINKLLKYENLKEAFAVKHRSLLKNKIDGTSFMSWFVENYPTSVSILGQEPDFQLRFGPLS